MNNASTIARQYLAAWNEADAAARRAQVRQLFTANARYVGPMMQGSGHEGSEATALLDERMALPGMAQAASPTSTAAPCPSCRSGCARTRSR
ncbi:hypothetical protein [Massilia sp. BSC265]|uniref:hypothetical protein n=1 Tax=Massilia sp. BSC265 TaxID=1549812 RepID=UPI000A983E30|nr:hypothetical protein [Massilia sp. BSC265]